MRKREDNGKISKSRYAVLVFTILSFITTAVSIADLYFLSNIDSLKKYCNIAIFALAFIICIFLIKTKKRFSKKKRKNYKNKLLITMQVLYFIITATFASVVTYVYFYLGSFNKTYVTYSSSLVAKSGSEIDNIKDVKNTTIGILKDKKSPEGYIIPKEVIKDKNLDENNKIKKYDNYSEMVADLYSGDVDLVFLSSDYATTFSSTPGYEEIATETKVIYKKSKKMLKTDSKKRNRLSGKRMTEPFTILLMGVDSPEEGLDKNTAANGDSIILITFNPKTLNATMISIPRDSYVPIACYGGNSKSKITHAAAYGSDCMMQTIEDYFDVDIDYYAKINFKGLVHLVDAIGGIDVDVPKDLCTDDSSRGKEVCIKEGHQHLDGEGALVLSRNRKQLAAGDLDRGQNQQLVIKAILNKLKNIRSASKFLKVLNTVSNNMDTNLTNTQMLSFYNIAEDLMSSGLAKNDTDIVNIQQLYLQGSGQMIYDKSMRMDLWFYVPSEDSRDQIIKAMNINLEKEKHKTIKKFSFSINEEYEKEIVGYKAKAATKVQDTESAKTVPSFVGLTKAQAQALANRYGISINFTGSGTIVAYQSLAVGSKIGNGTTISVTLKEETTTNNNTNSNTTEADANITVDPDPTPSQPEPTPVEPENPSGE